MWMLLAVCLTLSPLERPPQAAACLECHDTVNLEVFRAKTHGGLQCVQCHRSIKALPHDEVAPVVCARCHHHEQESFHRSVHGKAASEGRKDAPTCQSCHGKAHDIVSPKRADSPVSKVNRDATCQKCHEAAFLARLNAALPRRATRMGLEPGQPRK